jgi:hypothetical protein
LERRRSERRFMFFHHNGHEETQREIEEGEVDGNKKAVWVTAKSIAQLELFVGKIALIACFDQYILPFPNDPITPDRVCAKC